MLGVLPWYIYPVFANHKNKALFDDPTGHKAEIEELLKRPIRIYTAGESYPILTYTLLSYEKDYKEVEASGVFAIPTPTFEFQPELKGDKRYLLPAAEVRRAFAGAVIPVAAPPTQPLKKLAQFASLNRTQASLFAERPGVHYSLLCRALSEEDRIGELVELAFPGLDIFDDEHSDAFQAAAHWLASLDRRHLKKVQRSAVAEIETIVRTVTDRRKASGSPIGDPALQDLMSLLSLSQQTDGLAAALSTMPDIDVRERRGGATLLMMAASKGHAEAVRELLRRDADVNARDNEGVTPLMFACMSGSLEICDLLIAAGGDLTAVAADDTNVLHIACTKESLIPLIPRLIAVIDPNRPDGDGDTPLHIAAGWGLVDTVRMLLAAGADPNRPNMKGEIPLMSAVEDGREEVVAILLPITDIKARTKAGTSALGIAIKARQDRLAIALVEAGVPVASWSKIHDLATETGLHHLAALAKRRASSSERRRRSTQRVKKGGFCARRQTASNHH